MKNQTQYYDSNGQKINRYFNPSTNKVTMTRLDKDGYEYKKRGYLGNGFVSLSSLLGAGAGVGIANRIVEGKTNPSRLLTLGAMSAIPITAAVTGLTAHGINKRLRRVNDEDRKIMSGNYKR